MPGTDQSLKKLSLFSHLSQRDLAQLSKFAVVKRVQSKRDLYRQGDVQNVVYIILNGSVRLHTSLNSHGTVILSFLGKGEVLGIETLAVSSPHYPHTATCNENISVVEIPLKVFKNQLLTHARIDEHIRLQIMRRFFELQVDVCLSSALTPYRIAHFLLGLGRSPSGAPCGKIPIPLTRAHIAQKINSQTETVTRILSQWTHAGWIKTEARYIEILNFEALEMIQMGRQTKARHGQRRRRNF